MATFNKDLVVKQGLNVSSDVVFTKQNTESAGVTWITKTSNFGNAVIYSVAYGNNLWIALGYSSIRTSTDTITWTTRTPSNTTVGSKIAYGNNLWVAGGYDGNVDTSTDGVTWISRTTNFAEWWAVKSVAYGNGMWVAGSDGGNPNGGIRTSTDAITWTTQTSNFGSANISSVAYGNNLWVVGGYSGQIRTSTDTVTWTTQTSNFGNTLIMSVAYGNSLWVAGGSAGTLRTSTDGITWTTRTSNFGNSGIYSVSYGDNLWIAGGDTGTLRTSTDGTTWTTRTSNFGNTRIMSVAYGNSLWVAGGWSGQLRTSSALSTSFTNTLTSPALFENVTITLPSSTTALVGTSTTDILTNKTISGLNNTITNINLATSVVGTLSQYYGGTGINSLGAGIATFLGTPSSANLASTITDETGSGALVFGTSPTISTPILTLSSTSSTTSGRIAFDATNDKIIVGDGTNAVEYASSNLLISTPTFTANAYTTVLADKDKWLELSNGATAGTFQIPTDATANFPIGTQLNIIQTGSGQITIAAVTPGTTTVNGTPGLKLRAQWSAATIIKRAANLWVAVGDLAE